MESFYGGRPGASFIITKSFNSIDDMKAAFRKGAAYTDVYYDEYVIITVPDAAGADRKKQNGNVYRRGYDYTNEMGGAEFVGNISGPAGPVTKIDITHFNDSNFDQNVEVKNFTITNQDDLVPGAQKINGSDDWTYNDTIAWKYYYFNDAEQKQSIMKIGFKIPFPVIDLKVQLVNPNALATATRIDDKSHPFFSQWKFEIPQAKKGDSIKKISIISGKQNADINYETYDSVATVQQAKKQDDYDTDRLILIFTKVSYDSEGNEDVETDYYLGDYQIVQNIDITPQGYMRFTLPDGSTVSSQSRVIPRIIGVDLNETGQITFKWKDINGTDLEMVSDTEIQWIYDIDYVSNGNLKITWNTPQRDNQGEIVYENGNMVKKTKELALPEIQWIDDVDYTSDGKLKIIWNTPQHDSSGNIVYNNGEIVKKTKEIPLLNNKSIVNDVIAVEGIIYQTYSGIENQVKNITKQHQIIKNIFGNGTYYHDEVSNTWYKKIFSMTPYIKSILASLNLINPTEMLPGEYYEQQVRVPFKIRLSNGPISWFLLDGEYHPYAPWPNSLFSNLFKQVTNANLNYLLKCSKTIANLDFNDGIYFLYVGCYSIETNPSDSLISDKNTFKAIWNNESRPNITEEENLAQKNAIVELICKNAFKKTYFKLKDNGDIKFNASYYYESDPSKTSIFDTNAITDTITAFASAQQSSLTSEVVLPCVFEGFFPE